MQISPLAASLVAPLQLRPRERVKEAPPWHRDVPPDSVDVRLAPRLNRYTQRPLRFTHLTTEAQQYAQRLALYRDLLDLPPPGVPSPEELRGALEALERERREERARERLAVDVNMNVDVGAGGER